MLTASCWLLQNSRTHVKNICWADREVPAPFPTHKYISSTTKPALENWRTQIQVPEGMLCLVSTTNALTEAHTEDCKLLPSSHLPGENLFGGKSRGSGGWKPDSLGLALSQSVSNQQGCWDQMWASTKLDSSAANPKQAEQPSLTAGSLSICIARVEFVPSPLKAP